MWTILYGLGGGILAAVLVFAGGIALGDLLEVSQAEGAWVMSVAFFATPVGFVLGAFLGAVLANRR
ncbi:MAG: hypothetical protein IT545_12040 [Rhodobacteraceae bacterium]|nr:hypothetical protein [Paracoccaceae bacterium]